MRAIQNITMIMKLVTHIECLELFLAVVYPLKILAGVVCVCVFVYIGPVKEIALKTERVLSELCRWRLRG